jgi:hypothetical protein
VPGFRIEDPSTRHKLQCRIITRSVNEFVRKICLLVHALTNDREHQFAPVGQGDVDAIAELKFVEVKEHRRSVEVVDVAQYDGRAFLTG